MATANPFDTQKITLEHNKVITITKKTVRFAKKVYQTHNITGFSEGEIKTDGIPWGAIVLLLFVGSAIFSFNNWLGFLIVLGSIVLLVSNLAQPKQYGLLLTLNSGEKELFVTTDREGLKKVIAQIYEFIESEKDVVYQMSINNSQVQGNIIQGSVESAIFRSID